MMQLRRHDLVWLSAEGWEGHALRQPPDVVAQDCLEHWFAKRLPLVVGRQAPDVPGLTLGLAAPVLWARRRLSLHVPRNCVLYHGSFPRAPEIARLLAPRLRERWVGLCGEIAGHAPARVHGSYGWQRLSGLEYVTPRSDIDLHVPVAGLRHADQVASTLEQFRWKGPRLDGELLLPCGGAVAWREWLQWRRGTVDRVMVKRLDGVALHAGLEWLKERSLVAS